MIDVKHAERIARTSTELPPCVIQTWPQDRSLVLTGTYKLKDDGTRHGSLDLYRFCDDENRLQLMQSVATDSSILDVKISPHDHSIALSGQSTGSILVWKLYVDSSNNTPCISVLEDFNLFEKETLVLSIAFSEDDPNILSATLSCGEVAIIRITSCSLLLLGRVPCHDLEAWTCTFGTRSLQNVVFSGGDDAVLAAHDLRLIRNEPNNDFDASIVWKSNRIHEAGITAILPSSNIFKPSQPTTLWTGGYDDHLRSIDLRLGPTSSIESYLLPKVSGSSSLEGGVWRLCPWQNNRILASCMYRGGFILQYDGTPELAKPILEIKDGHDSMVYGGDWISDHSVVTCSFYDKQLQAWKV